MSEEEKKAIENLKTEYEKLIKEDNILFPLYKSDAKRLIDIIEKQSKEIEELKDMNERQQYRIELVSEDEIEERGDSIDESTMLKQIKNRLDEKNIPIETLLAEFERLEDIEDKKVQIEYNNVFNKGVKSVEDKIKAKIEELEKIIEFEKPTYEDALKYAIEVLQSLLEKE